MQESVVVKRWQDEARQEERRQALRQALETRFPGTIPDQVLQLIDRETDPNKLPNWLTIVIKATSIEQFQAELQE